MRRFMDLNAVMNEARDNARRTLKRAEHIGRLLHAHDVESDVTTVLGLLIDAIKVAGEIDMPAPILAIAFAHLMRGQIGWMVEQDVLDKLGVTDDQLREAAKRAGGEVSFDEVRKQRDSRDAELDDDAFKFLRHQMQNGPKGFH